jgi:hypothetical protein
MYKKGSVKIALCQQKREKQKREKWNLPRET